MTAGCQHTYGQHTAASVASAILEVGPTMDARFAIRSADKWSVLPLPGMPICAMHVLLRALAFEDKLAQPDLGTYDPGGIDDHPNVGVAAKATAVARVIELAAPKKPAAYVTAVTRIVAEWIRTSVDLKSPRQEVLDTPIYLMEQALLDASRAHVVIGVDSMCLDGVGMQDLLCAMMYASNRLGEPRHDDFESTLKPLAAYLESPCNCGAAA